MNFKKSININDSLFYLSTDSSLLFEQDCQFFSLEDSSIYSGIVLEKHDSCISFKKVDDNSTIKKIIYSKDKYGNWCLQEYCKDTNNSLLSYNYYQSGAIKSVILSANHVQKHL